MSKVTPILKWAGGKRQLLEQIVPRIPNDISRYYEPFLGAGAVLFELQPKRAIVNDTNTELINMYQVIKSNPDDLINLLRQYERVHSPKFFYEIRDIDREPNVFDQLSSVERAARTIYLNRTCYNGLYRVNRMGHFNTPIGHNTSIQIVNADGVYAINEYLNTSSIRLLNMGYQNAARWMRKTDFVFLDPPYYQTNENSFIRYYNNPFGVQEQVELKRFCDRLNIRGIRFMETNADCPEIRELYREYNQVVVDVRRCINTNVEGRRGTEIIITNY